MVGTGPRLCTHAVVRQRSRLPSFQVGNAGSIPVHGSMGIIHDEISQMVDLWFEDAEDPEMIYDAFMTVLAPYAPKEPEEGDPCPKCSKPLVWDEDEVMLYCVNDWEHL